MFLLQSYNIDQNESHTTTGKAMSLFLVVSKGVFLRSIKVLKSQERNELKQIVSEKEVNECGLQFLSGLIKKISQ